MRTALYLVGLLALAACGEGDSKDPDTNDSTETGDSGAPPSGELGFTLEGESTGMALLFSRLEWTDTGTEFGDNLLVMDAASDLTTVAMPAIGESSYTAAFPENTEDVGAWFLPALFNDTDASLTHDSGESIAGLGPAVLLYLPNTPSEDLSTRGYGQGWNALDYLALISDAGEKFHSLSAVPLAANLAGLRAATVGGDYAGSGASEGLRLAVVPRNYGDLKKPVLAYDEELQLVDGAFSLTMDMVPPGDHVVESTKGALANAIEHMRFYMDSDESGGFTADDEVLYGACATNGRAFFQYLPLCGNLPTANSYLIFQVKPGWRTQVLVEGKEPSPLSAKEALELFILDNCPGEGTDTSEDP